MPEPCKEINKVTIQKYTPDIYNKKRQRAPIRRKMVLVSQVNLQADESTESHSSCDESQHFSAAALENQKGGFLFWSVRETSSFRNYLRSRPLWCIPPDSPPPQSTHDWA
ncbi:hypothetical protein [Nibrella saemangeumensis]|uniref:hypothetical protein n=1 Tax=Nibrella saemangeumensis TaxID=1084526 RepID=UPI0031EF2E4A